MAAYERNDTSAKVIEIVAQKLNRDKSTLNESMTFEELGADSLDMVEVIMRIEEVFGIEVNDEDAEKFSTLSQAIDYVHKQRTK
jgi:acyl carrier protein